MGLWDFPSDVARLRAVAWDDGCAQDRVRNEFIIPELTALIATDRPSSILDIGAGTGYISRAVDRQLDYRPKWVLVDLDEDRLQIASERKPANMQMLCVVGDAAVIRGFEHSFEAAVISFTLLETERAGAIVAYAASALVSGGMLILAIPDVWVDVLADPQKARERAQRLLSGTVSLSKIDKFTGAPYPFHAMRTESLITLVLEHACALETLRRGGPRGEVYVLGFRKRTLVREEVPRG